MKKISFSKILLLLSFMLMAGAVFTSCKKDEKPDPEPQVEDGIYIKGAGTALTNFDIKGLFKITRNEVNQQDRNTLLEMYVAVKAGTDGFQIVEVAGATRKTYGPGANFAVVPESARIGDEPKVDFWRGSYAENNNKFTVPQDGLYHVVIETSVKKIAIIPVQYWGLIGAATPGGWSNDTQIPAGTFNLEEITFEKTNIPMTRADFKFRYSGGWKVVIDDDIDLGGGQKGVRVNTNFGGAVANLVPGGANINNEQGGKYTAKMVWKLGQGYTATMTRTGDLDLFNYTNTELGLVGASLTATGNWDQTILLHKPVVTNETNYTWTWNNVAVVPDGGGFKIREGQTWSGKVIGYPQVTMAGAAASNFTTNNDGNFVPVAAGNFDMQLKINAVTEAYTFTVNPAGAAPEMFILGDGTSVGWNNANPLPMVGTGGVYSITLPLTGGKNIKFLTTPGQWAPQYGTDATGTSTGGPLVYRPDENAPDPAAIPTPAQDGIYTVTMNTNTMTYVIAAPLYLLGDGSAAGWNNQEAIPMFAAANGVYFLKTNLEANKNIKFIRVRGQWAPQYGTDATGTSTAGPLVLRPDESAPDPAAIPTPATAGSYLITANTTALNYTIAPATR